MTPTEMMTKLTELLATDPPEAKARPLMAYAATVFADADTLSDADWLLIPARFRGSILAMWAAAMAS